MKASAVRELSAAEIEERIQSTSAELAKQRGTLASGTRPENPGKIRQLRRDVARMLTILKEKQKAEPEKKQKREKPPAPKTKKER